jgi:hypothetical protein
MSAFLFFFSWSRFGWVRLVGIGMCVLGGVGFVSGGGDVATLYARLRYLKTILGVN